MNDTLVSPLVQLRRAALRRILPPVIRAASPAISTAMRTGPGSPAKEWVWDHLLVPYSEGDRDRPRLVRSEFGAYFVGTTRDFVFRQIATYGAWEPNATAWVQSVLKPGDVFIDVGANIGYYTLLATRSVGPTGAVVALEPLGPAFAALRRNIEIDGIDNVRLVQRAAYDRTDTLTIHFASPHDTGGASTEWAQGRPFAETIAAAPLADLLAPDEIARTRLFKIDVEGGETRVLRGLAPLFEKLRPDAEFFIELSDETYTEISAILGARGFHAYALVNPGSIADRNARRGQRPTRLTAGSPLPPWRDPIWYVVYSRRDAAAL